MSSSGGGGNKRSRAVAPAEKDEDENLKRMKASIESSLENFVCLISHQLPINPVTAMDGKVYERSEIEKWIQTKRYARRHVTSPATNMEMDDTLIPAPHVYSTIQTLIESNQIESDIANCWLSRVAKNEKVKKKVAKMRARVNIGDSDAMFILGLWYEKGDKGLPKDLRQSAEWYKKSSDKHNPSGMFFYGVYLVNGRGGTIENSAVGHVLIGRAASEGSSFACYKLGKWYLEGVLGFPKDLDQTKYYWQRIANGSCTHRRFQESFIEEVKKWLAENCQETDGAAVDGGISIE